MDRFKLYSSDVRLGCNIVSSVVVTCTPTKLLWRRHPDPGRHVYAATSLYYLVVRHVSLEIPGARCTTHMWRLI